MEQGKAVQRETVRSDMEQGKTAQRETARSDMEQGKKVRRKTAQGKKVRRDRKRIGMPGSMNPSGSAREKTSFCTACRAREKAGP